MATTTNMPNIDLTRDISKVLTDAEESIGPVVKEVERTLLFTDVPDSAMKLNKSQEEKPEEQDDITFGLLKCCGGLERAFCFSDLEDIDESDAARLKSMQTVTPVQETTKEEVPAVEAADTDSESDDSAPKEAVKEEPPAEVPTEPTTETPAPPVDVTKEKVEETKVKQSETSLPPANALQASSNAAKDGKPMNALQAAKAAKKAAKEEGGKQKKRWSLSLRKSSRKAKA